jgi:hypothetical protein
LLLVALAGSIQIILWTDLPRQWILHILNERSGLVVKVESISLSWTGRTTARSVTIRLPLDREDSFSADSVQLSNRSIPGLILRRSLGLESVQITRPQFYVQRASDKRWNFQDLVSDVMLGLGGGRVNLAKTRLPQVHVEDAWVHMADPNGGNTVIGPFSFEGVQRTSQSWAFALTSGPAVEVRGTLVEDEECSHAADFRIEPNDAWVTAISGRDPAPIHIIGHWDGRVPKSGLTGSVRLDRLVIGQTTLTGSARISRQPDRVEINPDNMVLQMPAFEGRQVQLDSGNIAVKGNLIEFERVRSEIAAWGAQLSGRWDFDAQAGDLTASWAVELPGEGGHNGVCQATIKSPSVGRKEARLTTTLAGQSALGSWRIVAQTQGSGAQWKRSDWRTSIQECMWLWKSQQMKLDGASADIALDWPIVRLANMALPGASRLQAAAEYDISKRQWFARLDGQGVHPLRDQTEPLDIRLDAEGTDRSIGVSEFRIVQGQTSVVAKGQLAIPSYEIQNGHVQARWQQIAAELPDGLTAPRPGQWSCDANVAGPISPLRLLVEATITGTDVALGRRTTPKLAILLRGDIDSEQVTVATDPFHLFGGVWQARGRHRLSRPLTHLDATVEHLPVQAAADMAGLSVKCEGAAKAQIRLAVPNLDMKQSRAEGTWDVNQLNIPPLKAQQAHGRLVIGGGLVQFDDIELAQDSGKASGGLHFALDQPHLLFISFAASKWPIAGVLSDESSVLSSTQNSSLRILLDSKADIRVDTVKRSTDGEGWFSGQLLCGDQVLGQTGASASLKSGVLEVNDLTGDLLGGTIKGSARIPLARWTASAGQLRWQDVHLNRLGVCWPSAERIEGTLSGTLDATEARRPRALEPIRLELKTSFVGGHIGASQLGDCQAVAFLGGRRLLIEKADMLLCGGHVSAWGQLSPHAGTLSLSVGTDFNDVDLNQLAQVVGSQHSTMTGKLAGQGTLITATDWQHLSGEARINLSQSDLGDNLVVRTLYDALSLKLGTVKPVGTGQVNVRFNGSRIAFPSFVYFNRGVEIRGAGQIDDFRRGVASPVQAYAVGSTRVLKDVRLPGISELDRLMSTLQSGAVSVVVRGTLGKPDPKLVPLPEVREALRYLLWQQLRENK